MTFFKIERRERTVYEKCMRTRKSVVRLHGTEKEGCVREFVSEAYWLLYNKVLYM